MSSTTFHLRYFAPVLLILCAATPAWSAAEPAAAAAVVAPDPVDQMHEHLQALERDLRLQLLRIVENRSPDAPAVSAEELERSRRHLRSLEDRLRAWEVEKRGADLKRQSSAPSGRWSKTSPAPSSIRRRLPRISPTFVELCGSRGHLTCRQF